MATTSRAYRRRKDTKKPKRRARQETPEDKTKRAYTTLISELQDEANQRVKDRADLDIRWEQDLRQYHSKYEPEVEARLKRERKSRVFVNITRKRTHGWESRLVNMLFPTDDKNWGIKPTPMPDVSSIATDAMKHIQKLGLRANRMRQMGNEAGESKALAEAAPYVQQEKQAKAALLKAQKAADTMERLIEDQLVESQYAIQVRQAIHDACKVGTGIMKGPMISYRVRRKFVKEGKNWVNKIVEETPVVDWRRVSYYNFYPDMSTPNLDEGDGIFELHPVNEKELRKLQLKEQLDPEAIARLLKNGPSDLATDYVSRMRAIHNAASSENKRIFHVWEWHGVLDREQLECIAEYTGSEDAKDVVGIAEADELDELPVIIWFCNGEMLKYGIHPLDSGDVLYSAFQFERDETTPFGYGVPYMMRDSQSALNGAWRMMMDHGSVSTGPQIVMDPEQIEPQDGVRRITGNKIWLRTSAAKSSTPAFELFEISSNQVQLANIVQMAREFADEESVMPLIAQGDQGAYTTQTKGGMAILMNASNVVFQRVVKNFDDFMTVPNIRRNYEFNMLHSDLEAAKGDHQVDARGSSTLLVREMQAQNLMAMAMNFTAHPVLGPLTKSVDLYRRLVQAHNLPADEIVKNDDELQQDAQAAAGQQAPDPEQIKADTQMQLAQYDRETQLMIEKERRTTEMIALAQKHNMTLDQLEAKLKTTAMQGAQKERMLVSEAALQSRQDRQNAGRGSKAPKSGASKPPNGGGARMGGGGGGMLAQ